MPILWLFITKGFYRNSTKLAKTNGSATIYMKENKQKRNSVLINTF